MEVFVCDLIRLCVPEIYDCRFGLEVTHLVAKRHRMDVFAKKRLAL